MKELIEIISMKDFMKLDIFSKCTILSVLVLMAFWYISIFLFNYDFYTIQPYYIHIVFSFGLSVTWYFVNVIGVILMNSFEVKKNKQSLVFRIAGFISIFSLAGLIVIEDNFRHFTYRSFINFVFVMSLLAFLIIALSKILAPFFKKKAKGA